MTRGRRAHASSPTPEAAAAASRVGVSGTPARTTTSPAATSPPRGRTCDPDPTDCEISTMLSCSTTSSTGTTESAPAGTTAPVEMATVQPGSTLAAKGRPAADSPTIRSAPGRSADRTANPSIAELAKGGRSTRARTSAAVTRPPASAMGTDSAGSRRARFSTRSCASSTVSSEATVGAYRSREIRRASRRSLPPRRTAGPRPDVRGLAGS